VEGEAEVAAIRAQLNDEREQLAQNTRELGEMPALYDEKSPRYKPYAHALTKLIDARRSVIESHIERLTITEKIISNTLRITASLWQDAPLPSCLMLQRWAREQCDRWPEGETKDKLLKTIELVPHQPSHLREKNGR
jgi:hypothetical protein